MKRFSAQEVSASPGVYVFRNSTGQIIYVGKAKSLRKRLASYFQPSRAARADVKLRALINSIADYETIEVNTEAEALLLESRLIKEYAPRYNVELRDDKRFLHICIDRTEAFPRLQLTRIRKDDGRLYFGPFPRAGALRATVRFLAKRFRLRTCAARNPDQTTRRHCLDHAVRACSRACTGEVDAGGYAAQLEGAIRVLHGDTTEIIADLTAEMEKLAQRNRFEDAARLRDMIENCRFVCDAARRRTFVRATVAATGRAGEGDGVAALKEALGVAQPPNVIECFDISNIRGTMAVGSLVMFRNGRPDKNSYRRYRVRSPDARDDVSMISEVVFRRYARLQSDGRELPDLVVIDGGSSQLAGAVAALHRAGVPPLPVLGLAKKREEIYLPGNDTPLVLPRHHLGLRLLQAIRDEAHRFALSYHHNLRRKRIADSVLAEIEGVGPKRVQALLREFGSVRRLRNASPAQIAARTPGLGIGLATTIHEYLWRHASPRAPDPPGTGAEKGRA